MKPLYSQAPRARRKGGVIKLRLGVLCRDGGYWYARKHEFYLARAFRFDDLGSALRFLGYKEVQNAR